MPSTLDSDQPPTQWSAESRSVKCGFCGAQQTFHCSITAKTERKHYCFQRCAICDCTFLSPRPSQYELQSAYDEHYYGALETKFKPTIEWLLKYLKDTKLRQVRHYVQPNATVLDIGCGRGEFLHALLKVGCRCFGVELPGPAAECASAVPGLKLKVGGLSAGDFTPNSMDCVTLWHVFEHLDAPRDTLEIIRNLLKHDGYLIISIPNVNSLQSQIFKGCWFHLDPPRHLFLVGAETLSSYLKELGFTLVRRDYFCFEQNTFGLLQSVLNCFFKQRDELYHSLKWAKSPGGSTFSVKIQQLFMFVTLPLFSILALLESVIGRGGTMTLYFQRTSEPELIRDKI